VKFTSSWRVVAGVGLAILGATGTGCSLHYTKGPRNVAAAAVSVGAIVAGSIIASRAQSCGGSSCAFTGGGLIVLGTIGTLVFLPAAIAGEDLTADRRAWDEENVPYPPHPHPRERQPQTSSSALTPSPTCATRGNAPLVCFSKSSKATALAMDGVGR
jgi:hypothetical protein